MFFTIPLVCTFIGESKACDNSTSGNSKLDNINVDCISHSGKLNLNTVVVREELINTGKLNINDVRINGTLSVTGNLESSGSSIKDLNATGTIVLNNNDNISGDVDIVGKLTASNSRFEKQLLITSSIITLNNGTTTKNIYIRRNNGKKVDEYLYLNNSTVNGNITFESGRGKVVANSGSRINGSIIGGTLNQN